MLVPLCFLTAILALTSIVHAQPATDTSRWTRVDVDVSAPLPTIPMIDMDSPVGLHMASARVGSVGGYNESYRTTDGGTSWTAITDGAIPRRMVDSAFGVAWNGSTTDDGGSTWTPLTLSAEVTRIVAADAVSHRYRAVLYRTALDPFNRLALTTDGGTTWRYVDSVVVDGAGNRSIGSTTSVGSFPTSGYTKHGWTTIQFVDTATLVVGAFAAHDATPGSPRVSYFAVIDPTRWRTDWRTLPGAPDVADFVDRRHAYIVTEFSADFFRSWKLYGSSDSGRTWDSLHEAYELNSGSSAYRSFPELPTTRFLSPSYAVTRDGHSTDGGRTWQPRTHPFGIANRRWELGEAGAGISVAVEPIDSVHRFVAGPHGLFARSSDAGRTWQRSAAGGAPRALLALGQRVHIGRDYQSLVVSDDAGLTWRDVGVEGRLPFSLRTIFELEYPDTSNAMHVLGVADFAAFDEPAHLGVIESVDGGLTWQEIGIVSESIGGVPLSGFTEMGYGAIAIEVEHEIGSGRIVVFVSSPYGLYVSEDGGRTWRRLLTMEDFLAMSMSDADHGMAAGVDTSSAARSIVMLTSDRGRTWRQQVVDSDLITSSTSATALAVDDSTYMLYAFDHAFPNRRVRLLKTIDAGRTWTTTASRAPDNVSTFTLRFVDTTGYLTSDRGAIGRAPQRATAFEILRRPDTSEGVRWGSGSGASVDHRYVYLAAANDAVGRWTLGALAPPASIDDRADPVVDVFGPFTFAARIAIFDALGRLVKSASIEAGSAWRVSEHALSPGVYFVHVISDGTSLFRRTLVTE